MAVFEGKAALVYGAAQGIGRAVAREFARRGARVAIADIDLAGAEEAAGLIREAGGEALALACDVTRDDDVQAAAARAEAALGEADVVMSNVGVILSGDPPDIPLEEWKRILDLNLMSVVRSQHVFLPKMVARGAGHLVNTASFAGLFPYAANRLPYVACKAAIIAMTESLAIYAEPRGVRVSCFCPGPVRTGIGLSMKSWSKDSPMRGPGRQYAPLTPEEAAVVLADGMAAGRIVIPTDEKVWEDIRRHAEAPDAFVRARIAAEAAGDFGIPKA